MHVIVVVGVFFFAICSLCVKIFICCRVCRRDRYWDNGHSQENVTLRYMRDCL